MKKSGDKYQQWLNSCMNSRAKRSQSLELSLFYFVLVKKIQEVRERINLLLALVEEVVVVAAAVVVVGWEHQKIVDLELNLVHRLDSLTHSAVP